LLKFDFLFSLFLPFVSIIVFCVVLNWIFNFFFYYTMITFLMTIPN